MAIELGKKNTLVNWMGYAELCKRRLGYVPLFHQRLTWQELEKLGFKEAAKAFNPIKPKPIYREELDNEYYSD